MLRRLDLEKLTVLVDDVSHHDVVFLDPIVAQQAYLVARSRGLILRRGIGLPPWNAHVAHLVMLLCEGETYESIGRVTYLDRSSVCYHLQKARVTAGSRTSCALVATAYRKGWLPHDSEREALDARRLRD